MHQVDKKCDPKSVRHSKAQNVAYLNMPPNILSGASFANNKLHCTSASQPHKLRSYVRRRMRATHLSLVLLFLNTSYLVSLLYFYAPRFFAAKWWSTKVETDATGAHRLDIMQLSTRRNNFSKGHSSGAKVCASFWDRLLRFAKANSLFWPRATVFFIAQAWAFSTSLKRHRAVVFFATVNSANTNFIDV